MPRTTIPRTTAADAPAPRIALIHATPLAIAPIDAALARQWPRAEPMHLLDASLSADRARDGELTPAMVERFVALARYVAGTGVQGILFTCSAFGPAIERAGAAVGLPTLKPNEAMFEQALGQGRRFALVATFEPSLAPMAAEFHALAAQRGIDATLHACFVPDAMAALGRGDSDTHHRLVAQAVAALPGCDAVMLAQFSMADAAPACRAATRVPVLTSPDCAVAALLAATTGAAAAPVASSVASSVPAPVAAPVASSVAAPSMPAATPASNPASNPAVPPDARVDVDSLQRFIAAAMVALGLPADDAEHVGRLMAQADLQGSDGHGVIRLPQYARRIRAGGVNRRPDIRIVAERAASATIDGDNGMGHLVMRQAAAIAIAKARANGIGWVGSRASNHAGPASLYARMPLAHGLIGLYFAVGNANHLPPWGGIEMLLSTNPIAVAVPAGEEGPIVLDMATTVAAYGKVKAKAQRGEAMPEGWMVDREGRPLLDPRRADEGFLLPIGGYKGYGLSLVVGLLAGTLNGAAMGREVVDFNRDDTSVTNTGQAIVAIDPAAFGDPAAFRARVDALIRDLRGSARMPGTQRIWLPGEQSEARRRAYARDGIPIPAALDATLDALAADLGIAPLARH